MVVVKIDLKHFRLDLNKYQEQIINKLNNEIKDIFELLLLNEKTIKDLKRENRELKNENITLKARLDIWEYL